MVDVARDAEFLSVAGDHVDDGAQDLGLALWRPARPRGPAVLGDHQGKVTEPRGGQVVAAVCLEEAFGEAGKAGGGDGAEDIGEEVQADVVQIADEPLAALAGEVGEEGASRAEQR